MTNKKVDEVLPVVEAVNVESCPPEFKPLIDSLLANNKQVQPAQQPQEIKGCQPAQENGKITIEVLGNGRFNITIDPCLLWEAVPTYLIQCKKQLDIELGI